MRFNHSQNTIKQHISQINPSKREDLHIYGKISPNCCIYIFAPIVLLTPLYCYYEAVTKDNLPPFPHETITNTACNYPQDIYFRFFMLISAGFISIMYWVVYRWLQYEKKRVNYPKPIYSFMMWITQISVLGYLAAIATIDGAGYPNLHSIGAVFYFVILAISVLINTLILRDMHLWDSTVLQSKSFVIKCLLALYLFLTALYCLIGLLLEGSRNEDDKYLVIIEWNLVYAGLLWLISFTFDWNRISLSLKGPFIS